MPKKGVQTISEDQIERIFYMIRSSDDIDSKTGKKLEEIILELKNE
jgi:transposase-like protein